MDAVLRDLPAPDRIYETFGGVGMVTGLLRSLYPSAAVVSTELDADCVSEARLAAAGADIRHGDCFDLLRDPSFTFDAAVLDFNQCTVRDITHPKAGAFQKEVLKLVFERKPAWVEYTDSAVGKLHLNWKVYDCVDKSFAAYMERLDAEFRERYGYRIRRASKHHAASYFLLEPIA